MLTRWFFRTLPASMKMVMRWLSYWVLEARLALIGDDGLTPPTWLPLVGGGDFKAVGDEFFRYFVDLGGLQPHERVLDVGCGLGRMALPLTAYLDPARGRYAGFDVDEQAICYCQRHISPRYPNFEFRHAKVFSREYNLRGRASGATYQFPYDAEGFDFVIVTSVFTHMLPPDVENYMGEIGRVLRPGGRCLMTFFLLNEASLAMLTAGRGHVNLRHDHGHYRLLNERTPEAAVGHQESLVREWCQRHGLHLREPIHYGAWCGRAQSTSFQDIAVVTKR